MTEDQIELHVERLTDSTDRRLMRGLLTQAEYDAEMRQIAAWAEAQYAAPDYRREVVS